MNIEEKFISGKIEVTVFGGKIVNFTKADIQEMLDKPTELYCSDNLPKWLRENLKLSDGEVESKLKEILQHRGDFKINVASRSI